MDPASTRLSHRPPLPVACPRRPTRAMAFVGAHPLALPLSLRPVAGRCRGSGGGTTPSPRCRRLPPRAEVVGPATAAAAASAVPPPPPPSASDGGSPPFPPMTATPPVNVFDPPLTATAAAAAVAAAPTPPRPVVIIPGYGAPASDYSGMASALRSLLPPDTPVSVVPLTRRTWAATLGGRPVTPVLGALDAAIEAAAAASADGRVNLVGHSAGGWVARIWMAAGGGRGGGGGSGGVETGAGATPMAVGGTGGSRAVTTPTVATATAAAAAAAAATPGVAATTTYDGRVWGGARPGGAASVVAALVTLGTPHDSAEGVTAANMRWVNAAAPGAAVPGVAYTCICGSGVVVRRSGDGTATEWRPWRKEWLAKVSYELTAGVPVRDGGGGGVGDGIVPLEVAGLAGARNVVLEGVVHSPRGGADTWYGGEAAVRYWVRFLA